MPARRPTPATNDDLRRENERLHADLAAARAELERLRTAPGGDGAAVEVPGADPLAFDPTFQFTLLLDPQGVVLEANRAALDLCGARREEVVGARLWENVWWTALPDVQRRVEEAVGRVAEGEFVRFTAEMEGPEGRPVASYDLAIQPLFDNEGRVGRIVVEGRDVTDEVHAARALREAERERQRGRDVLRAVLDAGPDLVAALDREGRVLAMNRAFRERFEEAAGRELEEGELLLDALGAERAASARPLWARAFAGEAFTERRPGPPGANGEGSVLDVAMAPLREPGGAVVGAVSYARDVTAEEQAARARSALMAGQMGTWEMDLASGAVRTSGGTADLFGFAGDGTVRTPADFLARVFPDDLPAVEAAMARSTERGEAHAVEYRVVRPDGSVRWLASRGGLLPRPDGGAGGDPETAGSRRESGPGQAPVPAVMAGAVVDVTDRKEAEAWAQAAAHERDAALAQVEGLFAHAPVGFALFDREGRYVRVNEPLAAMNGRPAEAHLGRTLREVVPALADAAEPLLERVLDGGEPVHDFEVATGPADDRRYSLVSFFPIRHDGDVALVGLSVVDVTDRVRVREAVRASEDRYRTFLALSQEGIWRFDLDEPVPTDLPAEEQVEWFYRHGSLAEANEAFARMYGFDGPDDLVGARLGDLVPQDDPRNVGYLRAFVESGYRLTEVESFEADREGRPLVFLNSLVGQVEPADGGPARLLRAWGTQRDVTAQRAAEAEVRRLASVVAHTTNGVVVTDADGRTEWLNPAFTRLSGYALDDLLGRKPGEVLQGPDTDAATVAAIAERVVARDPFDAEILNYHKDGAPYWTRIEASPRFDEAGTFAGFIAIQTDVSARRAAEDALRQSEEQLRLALDAAGMGTWRWDLTTDALEVDEREAALVGLTPGELPTAARFLAQVHPEDRAALDARIREALDTCGDYAAEFRVVCAARGNVCWLAGQGRVECDAEGRPARMVGVNYEITERKEAEAALRAAAGRTAFRAALADALRPLADPAAIQAEAARVLGEHLGANRVAYFEVVGPDYVVERDYTRGARPLLGRYPVASFGPKLLAAYESGRAVVAGDLAADPDLSAAERAAFAAIQIGAFVGAPLVKGGRLVAGLALHHATPRAWTADEVALIEETAERTWAAVERARAEAALRESEARYRALFTSIDEGYCFCEMILDEDGRPVDYRFLDANPAFEPMTGLADAVGKTAYELVPGLETHWVETYARVALGGETLRFEQGSAAMGRWFDVYAAPAEPRGSGRFVLVFTDVTEQRRAEEALRASEARSRAALALARLGTWTWDVASGAVEFDGALRAMLGHPPDGPLPPADAAFDLVHPDDLPRLQAAIAEAFAAGGVYEAEYRQRRADDGAERHLRVYGQVTLDDAGQPVHAVGAVRDVTDERTAEAALRESEGRFRQMADGAPVMVWVTEPDGTCAYLNERWYAFTGQTPETALGFGWLSATHPDDRAHAEATFLAANERREGFQLEYRLRRHDGAYRWAIDSALPRLSPAGEFLGYVGSVIDITERREAEEALRQSEERARLALDIARLGTWVWDVEADAGAGDDRAREIVGFAPDEPRSMASVLARRVHLDDRAALEVAVRDLLDPAGEGRAVAEFRLRRADGSERCVRANARATFDEAGPARRAVRVSGTLRDVTERRRAEDALRQSEARLRLALDAADLGVWTHDFAADVLAFDAPARAAYGFDRGRASLGEVVERIHPEDRPRIERAMAAAYAPDSDGAVAEEYRVVLPGGATRWLSVQARIYFEGEGAARHPVHAIGTVQDVTARREAEWRIAESEQRARLALEATRLGMWTWEVDGDVGTQDARTREILGARPDDGLSTAQTLTDYVHPDDRPAVEAAMARALDPADGRLASENRVVRPDGEARWVQVSGRMFFDDGRPVRMVGTIRDVTERRQAEEALRQREAEFRQLAESLPQLVWTATPEGVKDYFNERWYAYTGMPPEPDAILAWADYLHPADLERKRAKWARSIRTGEPFEVEYRLRRAADGEYRWFITRAAPLRDGAGRVVRWFGTLTDVHDLRTAREALEESRERLTAALDAADTGTFRWDLRADEFDADEALAGLLGFDRPRPIRTLDRLLALVHPDDRAATRAAFEACAAQEAGLDVDFRVGAQGEAARWLHAKGRTVAGPDGRPGWVAGACADVTAQKAAEAQMRQLVDHLPQLAWWARPDGHIDFYNRQWYEYTGTTFEEMEGWGWERVHDPDVLPEVVRRWTHAIETGEPFEMEFPLRRADGAFRWFLTRARPLRGGDGRVVRWIGTNTNVDDLRRAEAALRASEARFRDLANAVPQVVWSSDAEGRADYLNERWFAYTGQTPEEALTPGGPASAMHPDDFEGVMAQWADAKGHASVFEYEYRLRRHDGVYEWHLARAVPIAEGGRVVKWIGSATNVHALKEAGSSLSEANRTLSEANRTLSEANRTLSGDNETLEDEVHAGAAVLGQQARQLARSGSELEEQAQTLTHQSALLTELTRALERSNAELDRSNRELDQFAYVASHDLKAPLRGIDNLAAWIAEDAAGALPPDSSRHLDTLQGRVRRMERLLDDLLAYSRAGRVTGVPEPLDTAALVADVAEYIAPPAGFRVEVEGPMPTLRTPRAPLETVLRNLLQNAVKHHDRPHEGRVVVSAQPAEEPGRWEIAVADDGPGIEAKYHERIFGLFQTLRPRDEVEGSGMGLAVVRKAVEAAGGRAWVESPTGPNNRGATFRFTWPDATSEGS